MRVEQDVEAHRALSDRTRLQLFTLVMESEDPMDVATLADQLQLHPNTVRAHLRRLELAGLVTSRREERTERGRPRVLIGPGPDAENVASGRRNYRLLSTILLGMVKQLSQAPVEAAIDAGASWGAFLLGAHRPDPAERADLQSSAATITAMMSELGFEPELRTSEDTAELSLHHCPFREVASRHQEVVCSLHLGILRGALRDMRSDAEATELKPFVTPSLCIAHVQRSN